MRLWKIISTFFGQSVSAQIVYRWWIVQFLLGESIHATGLTYYWSRAGETATSNQPYAMKGSIVTYFVLVTFHALIEEVKINQDLSLAIRSGKLSASMIRPVHPLLSYIVNATAIFTVRLFTLIPICFVVFFVFDSLRFVVMQNISTQLGPYLLSLILLFVMSVALRLILGLLAFGMTQTWGPELIFLSLFAISGGTMFPLDLLPTWAFTLFSWTPTFYMGGFPALVLMGHLSQGQFSALFARGCLVFAICAGLAVFSWKRGLSKYEAVGI